MRTFLSIDIDFWNCTDVPIKDILDEVAEWARENHVPLTSVMNHQQMLPLVNSCGAEQLINIDQHSDLTDNSIDFLDCGTWISFVKWRKKGRYLWVSPKKAWFDCNGDYPIFEKKKINRNSENGSSVDWKDIDQMEMPATTFDVGAVLSKNIIQICVCLSPGYADQRLYYPFYDWKFRYNVPYKRGLKSETHKRTISPPK